MNEEILIRSEKYNIKKLCIFIIIIGTIISSIIIIKPFSNYISVLKMEIDEETTSYGEEYDRYSNQYAYHLIFHPTPFSDRNCWDAASELLKNEDEILTKDEYVEKYIKELRHEITSDCFTASIIIKMLSPLFGGLLIALILWLCVNSCTLTVIDKRVYGVCTFERLVNLPIDSISFVSITKLLRVCRISTSSGNINFLAIKNCQAIYKTLNQLLIERQNKKYDAKYF